MKNRALYGAYSIKYSHIHTILYTRSYTSYPQPYLYSMPMAILHELRFIYSLILYTQIHTPYNILYIISFIYRLIFYTFTYYKIYSIPMASLYIQYFILYIYDQIYTLCPWLYFILKAIYYIHGYSLYLKPYFVPIAILYTRSYTS